MKKLTVLILTIFLCFGIQAQEAESTAEAESEEAAGPDMSGDKTGTNPINFTHDFRIYNEFIWLNTDGDGEKWVEMNREYAEKWPNITRQKDPLPEADEWKDKRDKFAAEFSPEPAK